MMQTSTQDWTAVCAVDDVPVLGARVIRRPAAGDIAVFRTTGNRLFALLDRCPHKGGPLSQGIVYGEQVACPLHNWQIGLTDGCAQAPDEGCTQRFELLVDDAKVFLRQADLQAHEAAPEAAQALRAA